MTHKTIALACAMLCCGGAANAEVITIESMKTTGPVLVQQPFLLDSINASQTAFKDAAVMYGEIYTSTFSFSTTYYNNIEVKVEGAKSRRVFINDKEVTRKEGYQPGQYDVRVQYVRDTADVKISLDADKELNAFLPAEGEKRPFSLSDNMLLAHYYSLNVSPSGKYAFVTTSQFNTNGKTEYKARIIDLGMGKQIRTIDDYYAQWMPRQDRYLTIRNTNGKRMLYAINPVTLDEELLARDLPEGSYSMTPTEDALIMVQEDKGPQKEDGVYEVMNMEDRQPGWRNRQHLVRYDLSTSTAQPLTYGSESLWHVATSEDSKYLYFATQNTKFSLERPTNRRSLYRMDMATLKTDTLLSNQPFNDSYTLIPGTEKILVTGCADAFDGVGKTLPDDVPANSYDVQLFLFDCSTKVVTPLTCDFDPSIQSLSVSRTGNYAFFTAHNADSTSLYRLNLKTLHIDMVRQPLEVVGKLSLSDDGSTILVAGYGACVSDKLYRIDTKSMKAVMIDDINKDALKDVALGTCEQWRFKSERGYELSGHVYLPAGFDMTKKYPMLVHYYGGCAPTVRRFGNGSHYPAHYWNALGYVVLIVNPSGCDGMGQEWASRHVNTAGEGVAEDIIEATKWYCDNHSFINPKQLGCLSASYGGFMTQWILTKTDMFAAGVSHAGISDHSSYWGYGYWGYSYSETSMAGSFPWTRKDLYIDRSPLFNADKIHTPLLFTHGTGDTNVPMNESVQMFTALKLLQCPTALVLVEGENHGIMDYFKRQKWINSITAWFQKYLKGDDTWWNALYSPKKL